MHTYNIQPWIIQIPGVAAVFWATFTIGQLAKSLMSSRALCSTWESSQKPKTYFSLLLVPVMLFQSCQQQRSFFQHPKQHEESDNGFASFSAQSCYILKRATEVTSRTAPPSHTAPNSTGGCWRTSSLSAGWSD